MRIVLLFTCAMVLTGQPWVPVEKGFTASFRGVSAPGKGVVWVSGTQGTCLRSTDHGASWKRIPVPGADPLDFRGVVALDDRTAWLMSSGDGPLSRIYATADGGVSWQLVLPDPDTKGFFDGIAFWDRQNGIVVGDPVDGHFAIFTTADAGKHWTRQRGPESIAAEGLFAASNTSLIVAGKREAWFATGGPGAARIFHSTDRGATWKVAKSGLRNDAAGAGVFSLARSGDALLAVGGHYGKPAERSGIIAFSADRGATWKPIAGEAPLGYRSAVAVLSKGKLLVAAGPTGSDVSHDGGQTWKALDDGAWNALVVSPDGECWVVGPKGRIAKLERKGIE